MPASSGEIWRGEEVRDGSRHEMTEKCDDDDDLVSCVNFEYLFPPPDWFSAVR
jgi:hypothetical protein